MQIKLLYNYSPARYCACIMFVLHLFHLRQFNEGLGVINTDFSSSVN